MRILCLIFLFTLLSSCGHSPLRTPAAAADGGTCLELVSHLVPGKRVSSEVPESLEIREALGITRQDLDELISNKFFQKHIFDKVDNDLHEKSALILSMIKKSRPDFDEKRVLMRYRRLFNMCGS